MARRALAGLLAVGVLATAAACAAVREPDAPAREARAGPVLGVNADLTLLGDAELERAAARLAAGGIQAVRQSVWWARVEPGRGVLDWTDVDRVALALERHNVGLVVSLGSAPAWARRDPPPPAHWWLCEEPDAVASASAHHAPPTDPQDLARFAALLAHRHGKRMLAVEIWPQANLLPHWRRGGPDPEDYAVLLAAVAAALREVAPGVAVVSGAPAPTTELGVCALSDLVFLERLALTGALEEVDAVGVAPLGLRAGPEAAPTTSEPLVFRRAELAADALARRGVRAPLWAMAWGWRVADGSPGDALWGGHPATTVARWTREAHGLAADWPWLGAMFAWQLQPTEPPGHPAWGYALWDEDHEPGATWNALLEAAGGRSGGPATATAVRAPLPREDPPGRGRLDGLLLPAAAGVALLLLLAAVLRRTAKAWPGSPAAAARRLPWAVPAGLLVCGLIASAVDRPLVALIGNGALVAAATVAPAVAVAAVAAAAPFWASLVLYVGPVPVRPIELLIAAAVAGRLLAWLLERPARADVVRQLPSAARRVRVPDALVIALVAWAALAPLWAEHAGVAAREWRTVIAGPALYYLLLRTGSRRERTTAALDGLVLGGTVAAVWALAGVALAAIGIGAGAVAAEGVLRANGPYASPNNLALFLGRLVPLVVAVTAWGNGRRRLVYAAAAVPIGLATVATFSRGAVFVGLPVAALYLVLVAAPRPGRAQARALALAAAAGVALAALLAPFARTERLSSLLDAKPGSTVFLRLRLWQSAAAMVRDHPWLGVGPDNFLYLFQERYVQRDAVQERFLSHPHNAVLDWWTRLGLPGLLVFLALVAANVRAGLTALSRERRSARWPLVVGALGMQVYAVAHGMVDNVFFLVDLALMWWIAQATLLAASESDEPAPGAASVTDRRTSTAPSCTAGGTACPD